MRLIDADAIKERIEKLALHNSYKAGWVEGVLEAIPTEDVVSIIERIINDLGVSCAYDMPGFWIKNQTDYKVIQTKYHKGYMQALDDVMKEIRDRFAEGDTEDAAD